MALACAQYRVTPHRVTPYRVTNYRVTFHPLARAKLVGERPFVRARFVDDAPACRPQVVLVVERDDPEVADANLGGLLQQLFPLGVVYRRERLVEDRVELGVGVAAAVGCPRALAVVESCEQ